jgi:hypothetical protein
MNVRVFGSGAGFLQPNQPAGNPTGGASYQDVAENDAKRYDSLSGYAASAYVGTTAGRPAAIPQNPLGLNVYIDTSIGKVIFMDFGGNWRDLVTGNVV